MTKYHLYRSGIRYATIEQAKDGFTIKKLDVHKNEWNPVKKLTKDDSEELENLYRLNPIKLLSNSSEYNHAFNTGETIVQLANGSTYAQAENGLWVQRMKKFPIDIIMVEQEPIAFISTARENCHVLVKEGYEAHTPLKFWDETISPAQYGVKHLGSFHIMMRDRVHLATDVWLPTNINHAVPVIFIRTPYGRFRYADAYTHFIQRGYAVVIQDTRGREDSEGEWIPMHTEIEDGDDSLNWIAENKWCDGNIGMIGASYGGYVQWAAAASGNPHLKAMVSIVTAGSPFIDIPRKGGAFVSGMLAWAFAMAEKKFKPENMMRDDWDQLVKMRPIKDIPEKALGLNLPWWDQWMNHEHNDDFWKKSDWTLYKKNIKAPALIVSGWFDDNGAGTTEAIETVANYPVVDKKIILGPWMHNGNTTRDIQGVALGNNALRYDLDVRFQQWFDYKLKEIDNEIANHSIVEYYSTGDNKWRTADQWPPAHIENMPLFLSSNRKVGELSRNLKESVPFDEYHYDPNNAAPHLIDISDNEIGVPADYAEMEKREDVLVYTSEQLTKPLTVAGEMTAILFAASSAKDTDWIVRLTDVDENGRSIKLTDGILRARYRNGFENEQLLVPNQIERFEIRSAKFAHTFKPRHRIRFTITSSAKEFIFPNANTGTDPTIDTATVIAHQKVYVSGEFGSYIVLPVE